MKKAKKSPGRRSRGDAKDPDSPKSKEAQVAAPLIHYYFQSKENLWRETISYSLNDLHRDALAIGNATRSLAPLDRLRVLLQTVTHFAASWPDNFVMIIAEARSHSGRFAWVQEHYTGVIFEQFRMILQDAKDKGVIKDIDIDQLAILLVGGVLVYFTANPEISAKTSRREIEKVANDYSDLMYNLLLDGICI